MKTLKTLSSLALALAAAAAFLAGCWPAGIVLASSSVACQMV